MSARGPLHGYRALDLTDHRGGLYGAYTLWGQHTEEVFGELLGLPRAEIDRLRAAEVIW